MTFLYSESELTMEFFYGKINKNINTKFLVIPKPIKFSLMGQFCLLSSIYTLIIINMCWIIFSIFILIMHQIYVYSSTFFIVGCMEATVAGLYLFHFKLRQGIITSVISCTKLARLTLIFQVMATFDVIFFTRCAFTFFDIERVVSIFKGNKCFIKLID